MHDVLLVATQAERQAIHDGDLKALGIHGETMVAFTPDPITNGRWGGYLETITLGGHRRLRRITYDSTLVGDHKRLNEACSDFARVVADAGRHALAKISRFDREAT